MPRRIDSAMVTLSVNAAPHTGHMLEQDKILDEYGCYVTNINF